ncbi:MAG: sigma-70 family RNA polymerase sigma factor [Marinifilaceae bacterium]|jgi:RNA polymerase sigma-70 factor (ECF subfamily)|nr:sigma-70 family RNA polymerase sigma factor [Marinifilaceae bacterium]
MKTLDKEITETFNISVEKAFSLLYKYYYNELSIKGISIIGEYAVVEDIIQNIFLKIYTKKLYLKIEDYSNYLKFAVRNECINYLKKNKLELLDQIEDYTEEHSEEKQNVTELNSKIAKLPVKCREIFEQVVFHEYTYQSVADDKKISVNTVKTQMKIAYKILRNGSATIIFIITKQFF